MAIREAVSVQALCPESESAFRSPSGNEATLWKLLWPSCKLFCQRRLDTRQPNLEMTMAESASKSPPTGGRKPYSIFAIPAPLRALFDLFPRVTYSANDIPLRPYSALSPDVNKLFVWTTENAASRNAASFNPACLKWQVRVPHAPNEFSAGTNRQLKVYLTFKNIAICTVFSNNHASPTGQLPFLVPSRKETDTIKRKFSGVVVTTADLQKLTKGDSVPGPLKLRADAYMSLIDGPIRRAWVRFAISHQTCSVLANGLARLSYSTCT